MNKKKNWISYFGCEIVKPKKKKKKKNIRYVTKYRKSIKNFLFKKLGSQCKKAKAHRHWVKHKISENYSIVNYRSDYLEFFSYEIFVQIM